MISDEVLKEFKSRMRISHSIEDDNIKNILEMSYEDLKNRCGDFDIDEYLRGRELVFERSRYVYNDSLEFFEDNFLSEITSIGLELVGDTRSEERRVGKERRYGM